MEFITDNLKVILLAVIALFAGIAITINIRRKSKRDQSTNKVKQKNNKVGGDQAGRDINR